MSQEAFSRMLDGIAGSLVKRTGRISLPTADATLEMGDDYYFLDAADARKVLVDGWGNPPGAVNGVLGMIFRKNSDFRDPDAWGAVVSFEATGFVSDDDASSADYDAIMDDMKEASAAESAEAVAAGYPARTLLGWAESPTYNATQHTVIWARNIAFAGSSENSLNYDIRVLGRRGVLSLNMVSTMHHLADVKAAAGQLGAAARFNAGARYADFDPAVDAEAGYGIAGLVAAGAGAAAAKKLGLLGVLLAVGKKFFAVILAGLAALVGFVRRMIGARQPAPVDDWSGLPEPGDSTSGTDADRG